MKENIVIIGNGGHANSCIDVIEKIEKFNIIGFVDKKLDVNDLNYGYSIIGKDEDLDKIFKNTKNAAMGIGYIKDPKVRANLFIKALDIGFKFPPLLSPNAYVSNQALIGDGTIVMHGAIVNAGVKIGKNCIINTGAIIDHDVSIGDNCHISTGAIINGQCKIDICTFVGSGSVLRENIQIGKNCFIAMGSKIILNIEDFTKYK